LVPDAGKMVFFDMQYGFQSGSEREPTLAEIEELICMTNRYLQSRITTSLESQGETRPVQAFATNIDWSYDFEGSPFLPFSLNFTADVTFATPEDAGVRVDKQVIYDGLNLLKSRRSLPNKFGPSAVTTSFTRPFASVMMSCIRPKSLPANSMRQPRVGKHACPP